MAGDRRPSRLTQEAAEAIAARAFLFLAEDAGRLRRFLGETGLDPAALQAGARSPAMLGAVLAHLMQDESALRAFAANAGIAPEDIPRAETLLGNAAPWDST